MSLRFRLTLLYSTLLGGTLLLFGALVYSLVSLVLVGQLDNILRQQAMIMTSGILRVDSNNQFDQRILSEYQSNENNLIFQVWGNDLRLQIERPRGWQDPLDEKGLHSSKPVFNFAYSRGIHLRVLSVPIISSRGPAGRLQVALNLACLMQPSARSLPC